MGHNRNWKLPALILAIAIVLHGGIMKAYAASGKIAYSEPLIADKTVRRGVISRGGDAGWRRFIVRRRLLYRNSSTWHQDISPCNEGDF